jgi:hypothetical protein
MRIRAAHALKNVAIGAVNVAIFYYLIAWCIEHIKPELLLDSLRRFPLSAVFAAFLVNIVAFACYALRLAILVDVPFRISFRVVNLGTGLNAILPFRLGELAKLYYVQRIYSLPAAKIFAAGLVEKFFDLVALAGLVISVLLFVDGGSIARGTAAVLFGLMVAAYACVLMFRRFSHHAERWLARMPGAQTLIAALREQQRPRYLPITAYTVLIWILNVAVVYVAFAAFLPGVGIGVGDAIFLLLIKALAMTIPTAPAGLGVFEAGVVAYLTRSYGIGNELALAAALVFHLVVILPQIAYAVLVLIRGRASTPLNEAQSR